jgi:hypothetical protein
MPKKGVMDYTNHMNTFPAQDNPLVFGIHQNAEAAIIQKDGDSIL